ncbi:MAG: RNA methyltransferase [Pseudomonadota bacterium]
MAKHSDRHRNRRPPRQSRDDASETAILYGVHTVQEALKNPLRHLDRLYVTENANRHLDGISLPKTVERVESSAASITKIAPPDAVHQGLLAIGKPLEDAELDAIDLTKPVLVLDQVTDPHNVGAIIRTSAAFNVGAIVTTKRFSPSATGVLAKAASGGLEHVQWARETNLSRAIETLNSLGFVTIGLDSEATSHWLPSMPGHPLLLYLGLRAKAFGRKPPPPARALLQSPSPAESQASTFPTPLQSH